MPLKGSPWPRTWRELWELTNRPRPIDPHAVRLGCASVVVTYAVVAVARHDPLHAEFAWLRIAVSAYGLAGFCLARRFSWGGLRVYLRGFGLLMPLEAGYVGGVLGNRLSDLAVTALATFAPLPFQPTARDVAAVVLGAVATHALLLTGFPPTAAPLATVGGILGGALLTGSLAAAVMLITRAGLRESMAWWQQACERERTLREFAEVTAGSLGGPGLLDDLAGRFLAAFGPGRCSIVLADEGGERFRVEGTAGVDAATAAALKATPLAPPLPAFVRHVIEHGQTIVHEELSERQRGDMARRWGRPIAARCLVVMPITVEDVAAGLVLLFGSEPRRIATDDVRLWEAMAKEAGVAVANARLLARLEHALGAKSEFLNTMSHELRSPLHVIIGYTDMLREEADALTAHDAADHIRGSALELLRLVEDTMTASRLDAGRVTVRADEFSAADLVAELAGCVRALPESKGAVAVRWETAPDVPLLRLDRLKLKEIVQNLVSNALKFTAEGEVRVTVAREAEALRIAVRDTGVGIPAEARRRVFEMFERIDAVDRPRAPGVGLGLYIVHRLVQLMGGTIELESAPERGSCFTVRLPLCLEVDGAGVAEAPSRAAG